MTASSSRDCIGGGPPPPGAAPPPLGGENAGSCDRDVDLMLLFILDLAVLLVVR
jgi:hypothetical protein